MGPFTIDDMFTASLPGNPVQDVHVFVGGAGPRATPIIAFPSSGEVYTGSLQLSIGATPKGILVFNPFRANLVLI